MKAITPRLGVVMVVCLSLFPPAMGRADDLSCGPTPVPPPTGSIICTTIADTDTSVPQNDVGNFARFFPPSIDGMTVAFVGNSLASTGVYKSTNTVLVKVADNITAVPDSNPVAFFGGFARSVSIGGDTVAFDGTSPASPSGVYTGDGGPLMVVADTATTVPGTEDTFTNLSFFSFPSQDDGATVFVGLKVFDRIGVYRRNPNNTFTTIADQDTVIPGGDGVLTFGCPGSFCLATVAFLDPSADAGKVAFVGGGGSGGDVERGGIYLWSNGMLDVVVDTNTITPGTTIPFAGLSSVSLDGGDLAFIGVGGGPVGVYTVVGGELMVVADTTSLIPDGLGNFQGIDRVSMDNGKVAFSGRAASQQGIYTNLTGPLTKVIDLNDTVNGKTILRLQFEKEALSGNRIAFGVDFTDGTSGVYVAEFPGSAGDVDGDGDVDRDDLTLVLAARNQPASGPGDPRDLDGDGTITVLDARILVTRCTRARCAVA